ncbi:hypothetical protein TRFO_34174 [Tritrichomonas foetus]|uniref:Uncharacterized protein n=1 Tax=Tritrichomonas foetus TaxID=1144522 RepID=A0A1J4JPB6_9EUKA|nr:hypothetical protein TRFO_34174 [Tritrichomonas foetus]|eukprot:OHS99365.1 hypothetical protein TRFO_34174 [Tritrichomonas foetus]
MNLPEKPLNFFLLEAFTPVIQNHIHILVENFPKSEENQTHLTETIYNYFKSYNFLDIRTSKLIDECCEILSVNLRQFFHSLILYFNNIPLNMEECEYDFPLFYTEKMKEDSLTSFAVRASTFYINSSIMNHIYYRIVCRSNFITEDNYPFVYSLINQFLFQDFGDKNSYRLQIIYVTKWAEILNEISKTIPDIVISVAFNHIVTSQNQPNHLLIFILKLYSSLHYPSNILSNTELISSTFQQLLSILNTNKLSNHLIMAGNDFIRNFLGFILQNNIPNDLMTVIKDINRFYNRIQNDSNSFNSTMVLFATLSKQTVSFFSISKFLSSVSSKFPLFQPKISDTLKTFITILNGYHYSPNNHLGTLMVEPPKDSSNNYISYIGKILDIVFYNYSSFKSCQKELAFFFEKVASLKFSWFMKNRMKNLIDEEFFQFNADSVLQLAITIFSNESNFVENDSDPNLSQKFIIQFKEQIKNICNQILDYYTVDPFTVEIFAYTTNSFDEGLLNNSLQHEIQHIIHHTTVLPLSKPKVFPIINVFNDWKDEGTRDINFFHYINNIEENLLKTFDTAPNVHPVLIKTLYLYMYLTDDNEQLIFTKLPMFLFNDSPYVSAVTMRLIQALVHIFKNTTPLESLLTLQIQKYEELFIYGNALIQTVESLVNCKITLTLNLASSLFSWQCVLMAAPYIHIRELGFKLSKIVIPILPSNFPNICCFMKKFSNEISSRSIRDFMSTFLYEVKDDYKLVSFRNVSRTSAYLLFHMFFVNVFKIFDREFGDSPPMDHIKNVLHAQVMTLINAKPIDDALLNNSAECYFVLNLMTLRLTTTSSFDKYTSRQHISLLLQDGAKILKSIEPNTRMYISFFLSINPGLNWEIPTPESAVFALIICFQMRMNFDQYSQEYIEYNLRKVLHFFSSFKYITLGEIIKIDIVRITQTNNGLAPIILGHMMCALISLFKKMRKSYPQINNGIMLQHPTYLCNDSNQPFDPDIWLPFLFSMTMVPHRNFPFLEPLADKCLSIYLSFTPISSRYIFHFLNEGIDSTGEKRLWKAILLNSPSLILNYFCKLAYQNYKIFLVISRCFMPIKGIKLDLLEIRKRTLQSYEQNDFDQAIYDKIGSILAIALMYLIRTTFPNWIEFFNPIYHISLFGITANFPNSESLVPLIDKIYQKYYNEDIPIPESILYKLSYELSNVFTMFTEEFLDKAFQIILNVNHIHQYIKLILPWFRNIRLIHGGQIVPNSIKPFFTSHSFLTKLFSLTFSSSLSSIYSQFTQSPLPKESAIIMEEILQYNSKFIIDYILFEKVNSQSLLLFSVSVHKSQIFPYIINFLRFEFSYYCEIQRNHKILYEDVINKILLLFMNLLFVNDKIDSQISNEERYKIKSIEPYLHILFVYCYIRQYSTAKSRKEKILQKICLLYNEENVENCIKHFDKPNQQEEIVNEVFLWMVSFPNLKESLLAINLFEFFPDSTKNKEGDILIAAKIVCALMNQCRDLGDCSLYCEYISRLMLLLDKAGKPPLELSFDLLKCNSTQFSPFFEISLDIVSRNLTYFQKRTSPIITSVLTAELTIPIITKIYHFFTQIIPLNYINLETNKELLLVLIPFIYVNKDYNLLEFIKKFTNISFTSNDAATKNNYDNNTLNYESMSDRNLIMDYEICDDFDKLILDIISDISGEKLYIVISFLMRLVNVAEFQYFHIIYRISKIILSHHSTFSVLTPAVFTSLAEFIIKNCDQSFNIDFIRLYENLDTDILIHHKKNHHFPIIRSVAKINLAFNESFPLILLENKFSDCRLTAELKSFVFSVQIYQYIHQEDEYKKIKSEEVFHSKSDLPINMNVKYEIERIDKMLRLIDAKNTNLKIQKVNQIRKIDSIIFRATIPDVEDILDC